MMPYDTYRVYQAGCTKSPAEVRHADERAGRLAAAAARLFRTVTRPARAARTPYPAIARGGAPEPASQCWPGPLEAG